MAKKRYDEKSALRKVSRVSKLEYDRHYILIDVNAIVGIHTWGAIDYLCHYCGWTWVKQRLPTVKRDVFNYNVDNKPVDKHPLKNKKR